MAVLKRIGPASAFKVGLVSYALLGLIAGAFCSLISLGVFGLAHHEQMPFARTIGLFAVIVCPVVYGIFGGIVTVIGAVIYNIVSSWVGGIEVDLG